MKKLLTVIIASLLLTGCTVFSAAKDKTVSDKKNDGFDIVTLFSSPYASSDRLWVGTFQIVFNEVKNNIIKHDIKFAGEDPTEELIGLNKEEFTKDMLDSASYYTSWGKTTIKEKEKIENDLKKKFNEKSNVLHLIDWKKDLESASLYAYAMIKKDFEFLKEFDNLGKFSFNNSKENYDFFGINEHSDTKLDKNLDVLFYNNENDYAVKLHTKSNDTVYLYKTNSKDSFDKIFSTMKDKEKNYKGDKKFNENDTLKIPNLRFENTREYKELCNKPIEGSDLYISKALETIEMELNSKGGKVKSEAVILLDNYMAAAEEAPRQFNFDKTFVMFLIDKGKNNPYLALQINDLSKFTK